MSLIIKDASIDSIGIKDINDEPLATAFFHGLLWSLISISHCIKKIPQNALNSAQTDDSFIKLFTDDSVW